MNTENLKSSVSPQAPAQSSVIEQPPKAPSSTPRFAPGTLQDTQDTFEHQRQPRHDRLWTSLEYAGAGIVLGAATAGVGLITVPYLAWRGTTDRASVREANPLSLRQDIFFYKGLCDDRETSAAWVKCLKKAHVLCHGRDRVMAKGEGEGMGQLGHAIELIQTQTQGTLSDAARQGIESVVRDFNAETQRLAPFVRTKREASHSATQAQLKKFWFQLTDAVHVTNGDRTARLQQKIGQAERDRRDAAWALAQPPQACAWKSSEST